jgi:hypothetical protein
LDVANAFPLITFQVTEDRLELSWSQYPIADEGHEITILVPEEDIFNGG